MGRDYFSWWILILVILNQVKLIPICYGQDPSSGAAGERVKDKYFLLGTNGAKKLYIVHGIEEGNSLYGGYKHVAVDQAAMPAVTEKTLDAWCKEELKDTNAKCLDDQDDMAISALAPEKDRLEVPNAWTCLPAIFDRENPDTIEPKPQLFPVDANGVPTTLADDKHIALTAVGFLELEKTMYSMPILCVVEPPVGGTNNENTVDETPDG